MKVYTEYRSLPFGYGVKKIKISGDREISILPLPPKTMIDVGNVFAKKADTDLFHLLESLQSGKTDNVTIVFDMAYTIFGLVLYDNTYEIESPEPTDYSDDAQIEEYAKNISKEMNSKVGRLSFSFDDVSTVFATLLMDFARKNA